MGLRILFFNRSYLPDVTATGQLSAELCQDLVREHGCSVSVIAGMPLVGSQAQAYCARPRRLISRESDHGVTVIRVRNTTLRPDSLLGRIANYLSYFCLSVWAWFFVEKPDVVITLTDPPIIGLLGSWSVLRWRVPFVISVRDLFPEAARGLRHAGAPLLYPFLDWINRSILHSATRVVAIGTRMQARLIEHKKVAPAKVRLIYDWADSGAIRPGPPDNPFSRTHNLFGRFVVMYAGNLGASSGLSFVLDAADSLRAREDIIFVFVGEGVMKESLMQEAQRRGLGQCLFLPFQPRESVSDVFASADVFLVPLKAGLSGYSVPSKLYAVMASARPYIASVDADSETAALTGRYGCGVCVPPEDPAALCRQIENLRAQPGVRREMGQRARAAAGDFDRAQGVRAYYELCREVAGC